MSGFTGNYYFEFTYSFSVDIIEPPDCVGSVKDE